MRNGLRRVVIVLILLGLVSCSMPSGEAVRPPGSSAQSEKERVASPAVPSEDLAALVEGNSTFALDLYQQLREEEDGNLFYSPFSISLALGMTYAGARGETERQMVDTLHFTLPQEQLHPAFNRLDQTLASRGEGAEGKDSEGFRLHIVNRIWGQQGYEFLEPFLDTLATNYGAGLRLLDFADAPEEARATINKWVGEQTEGRIEELIPPNVITRLTRLVLTNAIYFNAAWAKPFNEDLTKEATFHMLNGGETTVPMMHQKESFGYAEGAGYQAVELPYDGQELSMVLVLPDAGTFSAFEESLDVARVEEIMLGLQHRQVALAMPKFEVQSAVGLKDALAAMGMPDAFSMDADLSGMDGTHDLFIQDVVHKAFVTVDEEGTEAAAATAVVVALKSALPEEPVEMTVDRPFLFLIRDVKTGTVLFVGRVVELEAE